MNLIITFEARFVKDSKGDYYARGPVTYEFLKRYLMEFEHVYVFVRVEHIDMPDYSQLTIASGDKVSFIEVPYYVGPVNYLKKRFAIKKVARLTAEMEGAAYILRVPGQMGNVLESQLRKIGKPYSLEVVADPWDVLSPGSVKVLGRSVFRVLGRNNLYKQCQRAKLVSYVTQFGLQNRYPPKNDTMFCSDVILPDDCFRDDSFIDIRHNRLLSKINKNEPIKICFVGAMQYLYKAPDILIKAVAKCINEFGCNIRLTIIGDGQQVSYLQQLSGDLNVSGCIEFPGKFPPGDAIFQQFDDTDLFILPSRQEGMPRTLLEAMARSTPCLASNVGGIPELLNDDYLVKPDDVDALADKILRFIERPAMCIEMGVANVKIARQFSLSNLKAKWKEFYCKTKNLYTESSGK